MNSLMERILGISPVWVYLTVALLVFAEDAIFVGFVIPGETAAVIGGVAASRGHVQLWAMVLLVIFAAIVGDSVGYEVGKRFGQRLLGLSALDRYRAGWTGRRTSWPGAAAGRYSSAASPRSSGP